MTDEPKNTEPNSAGSNSAGPLADPAVRMVGPGDGETIVLGTTRLRVLEDGSNTEHRLGLTESVLAPHTPGPPQHRHAQHDEGFYVISGTVRFTTGDTDHDATPGTFVMVPPGAPHTFANTTDQPAVMLSILTPDLYVRYFRDLQEMITNGQALTPETNIRVMSRYGTEPVTEPVAEPATEPATHIARGGSTEPGNRVRES